jgi:hypothetical protein
LDCMRRHLAEPDSSAQRDCKISFVHLSYYILWTDSMVPSAVTRVVALPLLVLLHLVFSLVSLVLRVSQSVLNRGTVIRRGSTPRHIALSLPSRSKKIGERSANSLKERRALLETLKRTVRWAGEDGVRELSVYTDLGMSCSLNVVFG